jgi:hypothetical protein
MAGVFADVKKTAVGAGALLVLAVLFADPSGMGGEAVKADEAKEPAPMAKPQPKADPAWFSREPVAEVTAPAAQPSPEAAAQIPQTHWQVSPPPPRGDDFPPRR